MDVGAMDCLVEQLKCIICGGYLMWSPIVLLRDGSNACGNCCALAEHTDASDLMVREQFLEELMSKMSFPCKYKTNGCQERLFFDYFNHREEECVYRPLVCPTMECLWSGPMFGVESHFTEVHSAMVKKALNFKLELDQDSEETVLVVVAKVPFVAKCVYNADQCLLFLEINCFTLDDISYKVWLSNGNVGDIRVSLKKKKCLPYMFAACDGLALKLEKYLPVLEDPNCIMLSVEVVIERGHGNDAVVNPNPDDVPQIPVLCAPDNGEVGNLGYAGHLPLVPADH